jgi:ATP-dependent RNA circularization protein (DNA/RNA ligase family)
MKEYHKIQTVILRSSETNFKQLMEGQWTLPEFKTLKDIPWTWTEKIDGTNIRIMWNGSAVRFGGKTDDAHIPAFLLNILQQKFTAETMKQIFTDATEVCLYGEGYDNKIQKDGNRYIAHGTDFILFDVKVGNFWLSRENVEDIATKLQIEIVPIIDTGTLQEAVEFVKKGYPLPLHTIKSISQKVSS